jgi:hypothetical protein
MKVRCLSTRATAPLCHTKATGARGLERGSMSRPRIFRYRHGRCAGVGPGAWVAPELLDSPSSGCPQAIDRGW